MDDWFFVESMSGIKGFVPKSYFRGLIQEVNTCFPNINYCQENGL